MKKLFSIFFVLVLLLPVSTQAQLREVVNDSPESGYLFEGNGQIKGIHNAPEAIQAVDDHFSISDNSESTYVVSQNAINTYRLRFDKGGTGNYPQIQLHFITNDADIIQYTSLNAPQTGTYNVYTGIDAGNNGNSLWSPTMNIPLYKSKYCFSAGNEAVISSGSCTISDGWNGNPYIVVSCYTSDNEPINVTIGTRAMTLTAVANVSSYGTVTGGGTYEEGTSQTITATPNPGFRFVQWNDGNTNASRSVTLNDNLTYTATFQAITYNLTYDGLNGATNTNPATYTVETATINLAAPGTRTGYTFTGWTCGGNAITQVTLGSTGDKTITANWTLNTYAVTYNAGANGTGTIAAGSKTHGVNFTLSSGTFTREGYTQTGWSTTDGGSKVYNLGGTYTNNEAVTLYPFWTMNSHTLTWNANGGSLEGGTAAGIVAYGTSLTAPTGSKTGYTLSSWSPAVPSTMPDENVTCTAQWTADTYTLTYDGLNGASNSNPATYTIETPTITLANPGTRTGYTFTGWTCGGSPITQITVGSTGNKIITANWTLDAPNYDLTFQAGANGSVSGTAASVAKAAGTTHSLAEGTAISLSATANTFYQFKEWQNTSTGTKVSDSNPYNFNLTANTDLTAVFELANPIVLADNGDAAYYAAYDALNETSGANVQLSRTLTGGYWSTICLPFDVDFEQAGNEIYDGKFYEFKGATGDYTGIDLHFATTGYVYANTPYLFRAATDVTSPTFYGLTLRTREVQEVGTIGNVKFRGTIAYQKLDDNGDHTILGLYNNKIYYPNTSSGTYIRAFRGYFIVNGLSAGVQPRVRIVADGQVVTEIESVEAATEETVRKYMENGVMVIERNGVKYDALGGRIE